MGFQADDRVTIGSQNENASGIDPQDTVTLSSVSSEPDDQVAQSLEQLDEAEGRLTEEQRDALDDAVVRAWVSEVIPPDMDVDEVLSSEDSLSQDVFQDWIEANPEQAEAARAEATMAWARDQREPADSAVHDVRLAAQASLRAMHQSDPTRAYTQFMDASANLSQDDRGRLNQYIFEAMAYDSFPGDEEGVEQMLNGSDPELDLLRSAVEDRAALDPEWETSMRLSATYNWAWQQHFDSGYRNDTPYRNLAYVAEYAMGY